MPAGVFAIYERVEFFSELPIRRRQKKFKNALDKRKRLLYDFDPSLLKQRRSSLKIEFNEPISVNIGKLEELLRKGIGISRFRRLKNFTKFALIKAERKEFNSSLSIPAK